ncbi:hypothetical protein A2382_00565 [Candidatus Woesebacteria bacterium RIFOXYB1_FULL_38_16]|uniref:Glycosyltransferase 2-like domain-containing protein n=1 Tax=Candidatus Woesebacteria bacterium RIFOXYB1_FULL_38_16 TaxID=1802538 RepID=A0A1F8CSD7_9BACT|nr:MAG: hypothetical protein A2191_01445 [Candidatus Woesebacteria bacterium RIFOXYA1_FULL_38_9]OGM79263.1 MAG: hypothetical protein A2382_00565 [Candidatus Woesebacteria bacterium RIFOXYB1_FULL_38_16]
MKLSVVLAVKNEEKNLRLCLESVKEIAEEIVIVDEYSTDRTVEIAREYGSRVFSNRHKYNFHESKQLAVEKARGEWILQLDADERVSSELADEIRQVIDMSYEQLRSRVIDVKKKRLFEKHQYLIEKRDGKLGKKTGEVAGFFIPRVNFFLGSPLIHAGVYPDGVIRLVKKGKARLPAKSVHEQFEVDGEVVWLSFDLEHHDSPTLKRYVLRMNRYTDLRAFDFKRENLRRNILNLLWYVSGKPLIVFLSMYIRHGGYKDGMRGFIWSFLSSLHFPIAYFKYWNVE